MKWIIKWTVFTFSLCCILYGPGLYAREIILIENLTDPIHGKTLISILNQKYQLPQKLITYNLQKDQCTKGSDAILHLCIKRNGDIDVLKYEQKVLEKMLSVFLESEGQNEI